MLLISTLDFNHSSSSNNGGFSVILKAEIELMPVSSSVFFPTDETTFHGQIRFLSLHVQGEWIFLAALAALFPPLFR